MTPLITLENVSKRFGGIVVADDIRLTLDSGEILGLIGPNGAGKTSLFNLISGLITPDSGSISFAGRRIDGAPMYRRARLGLSRTWQNVRLFQSMTVLDNLLVGPREYPGESIFRSLVRSRATERAREASMERAVRLLDRTGLSRLSDMPVSALPYGQQKLVGLARALMNDGRGLLLDEPMAGVEGQAYDTMKRLIREAAGEGKAVCVVEHNVSFVKDLCDRALFMFSGRIIAKGTVDDLLANRQLAALYFGS